MGRSCPLTCPAPFRLGRQWWRGTPAADSCMMAPSSLSAGAGEKGRERGRGTGERKVRREGAGRKEGEAGGKG